MRGGTSSPESSPWRRPAVVHLRVWRCGAREEELVGETCSWGCTECGDVLGLDGVTLQNFYFGFQQKLCGF